MLLCQDGSHHLAFKVSMIIYNKGCTLAVSVTLLVSNALQSWTRCVSVLNSCLSLVSSDRQFQLERGDTAAQEVVNSLQVLEIMAGAMAAELKLLVTLQMALYITLYHGVIKGYR